MPPEERPNRGKLGCLTALLAPFILVEAIAAVTTGHDASCGVILGAYAITALAVGAWIAVDSRRAR